jgi:hypothetical protein
VAEYALIDGYLDALRTQVRWRKDVEDLVAEVEDHLYSTVERFEARGTDPKLAQRQTLDRFGDPDLMAEAFASTPQGGIAVPTKFTNTAGFAGIAASALWVAVAAIFWIGSAGDFDDTPVGLVFVASIVGAGALTVWATAGLRQRLGGLGALGLIGLVIVGIGVAASVFFWAIPFWMGLQGLGMLLVAVGAWPMGVAPKPATAAYGSGMMLGAVTFVVLRAMEVGPVDEWGDYEVAWQAGLTVGVLITAAGLLGLGIWLRKEEPADFGTKPDEAITA